MNGYVYLMYDSSYYKIGYTNKKVKQRLNEIQIGNPNELMLITSFKTIYYKKLEYLLHKKFKTKHIRGEWFDLTLDDVKDFENICEQQLKVLDVLKDNPFF